VDEVTELAFAARDGDREALSLFIRRTWPDVARLVTAVAGSDLAEDVAQDTYIRALRALPRYRGESSARTWLLSIARRVAADAVRAAGRRPRTTAIADWDAVAVRTGAVRRAGDEAVLLGQLVAALHPDRHEAFVLTQVLDLSYAEAAEVCGCPVGTIRSRVARAREDLVRAVDDGAIDDGRRREA
jgi:RNA polymerase sigma-70 factor, ECF subfamily